MKVSYSKLLVQGVIATTLLMSMSCQKKGSARGVQPNTATKTGAPTDAAKDENKNVQKDGLGNIPEARGQTVVTSGDSSKVAAKEEAELPDVDVAATTSGDATKAASTTKKETEAVKATTTVVKTEAAKTTPAAETKATAANACSEAVVKEQQTMTALYNKIVTMDKAEATTSAEKEANYTAYYKQCMSWNKLFTTEAITKCAGKSFSTGKEADVELTTASWNISCYKYSEELKKITKKDNEYTKAADLYRAQRITELKKAQISISNEAKDMFAPENSAWKMFIVEGEIQKEKALLVDAVKDKKMACTVSVPALDKYTDSQNVIVSITGVTDLIAADASETVKSGVELAISIRAEDKDATAEQNANVVAEKSVISCSGIELKDVKASLLKKAFGKHITILAEDGKKVEATKAVKQN